MDTAIILPGDRPTGKLHLTHYFGSLQNRTILQNYPQYKQYVTIANWQTLTDNASNVTKIIQ